MFSHDPLPEPRTPEDQRLLEEQHAALIGGLDHQDRVHLAELARSMRGDFGPHSQRFAQAAGYALCATHDRRAHRKRRFPRDKKTETDA